MTNTTRYSENTMFEPILQQLGLAKNESTIYEVLLTHGELAVSDIAQKSQVHRRNVYDSLKRLIERGLVFEILSSKENAYQAVDPQKFQEFLQEKQDVLARAMPHLQSLYHSTPHTNEIYVYRGVEGWKNYLRDIIRVGKDFHCISGKGAWLDPRVADFFPQFIKECERKNVNMYHVFDPEVRDNPEILKYVGKNYRFFPKDFVTTASADVFGEYVCIPTLKTGGGAITDEFSMTVIVNPEIADAFRTWFKFLYEFAEKP